MIGGRVEPYEHRRIAGDGEQHRVEAAQGMTAKELYLPDHHAHAAHLVDARGKVAMPEERQLLQQRMRREQHPPQPPGRAVSKSSVPASFSSQARWKAATSPSGCSKRSIVGCGPAATARWISSHVAPKAARRNKWPAQRRFQGRWASGT